MDLIQPPDHECQGARVVDRIGGGGIDDPQYFAYQWSSKMGLTMWITNRGNNSVSVFTAPGIPAGNHGPLAGSPLTGGGLNRPAGIVADRSDRLWVANNGGDTVTELSAWGPAAKFVSPPGGYTGAGLNHPWGLAIDKHNNLWVTNRGGHSVTMFVLGATAP